jgi:hypothetical protein
MVIVSDDSYGDVTMHLVDGYIVTGDALVRMVTGLRPHPGKPPEAIRIDPDVSYSEHGFDVREEFCRQPHKPGVRSKSYCEAWLLRPQAGFGPEFELKRPDAREADRRLIVTLDYRCEAGELCLQNLLTEARFEVIPQDCYRRYRAFKKTAQRILNAVSRPFLAPCVAAADIMARSGYRCEGFD